VGTGAAANQPGVPDVDLDALGAHVGLTVRVGGLVTELAPDGFLLDDGTATGRVALAGDSVEYLPLIEPGDALNATGRVERAGDEVRLVVEDAGGLVLVGDLTAAEAPTTPDAASAEPLSAPQAPSRLAGGLLGPMEPGTAGIAGVVTLSALSLAVTVLRRRRARRLLAARVGARLAGIAGPSGPASTSAPAPPPPG
jgi:hypothetical protein